MAPDQTCENCTFWKLLSGVDGECHRYPPRLFQANNEELVLSYPPTKTNGFCGEFKQKPGV